MYSDPLIAFWIGIALIAFVVGLLVYFVPSFIAFSRGHPHRLGILAVNLFAGWTFIGWVGSLVGAIMTPETCRLDPFVPYAADTKVCPRCAETVKRAALVCRFCGYEFGPLPPPPPLR